MSDSKGFWSHTKEGLYVGFVSLPLGENSETRCCHAFDPTPDREQVQSFYADDVTEGEAVTILLIKMTQSELSVSEVTQEIHNEVNAYLRARGDEELSPFVAAKIPDSFLTHIALWRDGEFGSLVVCSQPNDDIRMQSIAQDYVNNYGDIAANAGLTGVILLMIQDEKGWSTREIATAPISEADMEARPNGGF